MSVSTIASLVLANTTTNAGTITLPPAQQIPGRVITFKDSGGNFVNKALTLTCSGADTFEDGTTTKTLRETYGTVQVAASSSKWFIISGTQVNTLAASTIKTAALSTINISSATATLSSIGLINQQGSTLSMYQASTFLYFNNFIVAGARVGVGQMFYPALINLSPITTGLTYNFDATNRLPTSSLWTDLQGTNNITLINSPTVTNAIPAYVTFNGSTQYGSYILLNQGSFTITMWVRTSSTADNAAFYIKPSFIGEINPGAPDRDFGITAGAGYAGIWHGISNSDQTNQPTSGGTSAANYIANSVWHEITVTSSFANGTKLFVNTVQIGSALSQSQNPTGNPFFIGAANNNPNGGAQSGSFGTATAFVSFDMSALFVYSRELSAGEITTNYNTFRARFGR
jgi:hypothetical protein